MVAVSAPTQRISQWAQIRINLFWFANNFHWIALISVVIPAQVSVYFGSASEQINLAYVVVWGTLVAFFVNPLTGSLSDYVRFRLGRRRPFMIIGTIVNLGVLVAFAFLGRDYLLHSGAAAGIPIMAGLFILLQISNNFANAPWSAIIADQVPAAQRGSASGWFGIMTLLGTIFGFLVAGSLVQFPLLHPNDPTTIATFGQQVFMFYMILAAIQGIFVLITVLTVHEHQPRNTVEFRWGEFLKRFRLESRTYPDFTWVLLTRVLVMTGIWSVNNFLLYYFTDVLGLTGQGAASNALSKQFFPIVLGASLVTTFIGGTLSDRIGRKPLVYACGGLMTITCLLFILAPSFTAALIAAGSFGLGYGAYTSVDWALATDVLPPKDQAGKDMGIWSAAGIIPQVLGVLLGGVIINTIRQSGLGLKTGYSVLFGFVVVLFALGTLLVSRVKGAR